MKKQGFTLTEMAVVLAILAVVVSIFSANFTGLTGSSNMVSNANGMIGAFNYARLEAVKRGANVGVAQVDGSSWTGGIAVWVDADDDDAYDSGEELRVWPDMGSDSIVTSTNSAFTFNATGSVNNSDTLQVCDSRTGEKGMSIQILASGAIIADQVTCG